jgi:3-methyladenine DNA glycosylase AlkD
MNKKQVMSRLQTLGTAQNRKVYARQGVAGQMFGVSYANLGKLAKEVGTDQELAEELWATGNHDARVLAAMIADPAKVRASVLERWKDDLDSYVLADAFSSFAARTAHAKDKMKAWVGSRKEFVAAAGWNLVSYLSAARALTENELERQVPVIEKTIHKSANRVRYAMNNALISIGVLGGKLQDRAVAAARRIGPVEVDHGETGCQTPDAEAYNAKTLAYRKKKASAKKPAKEAAKQVAGKPAGGKGAAPRKKAPAARKAGTAKKTTGRRAR